MAAILIATGILIFGIIIFMVSYFITKAKAVDLGLLAFSITLIAWGSLLFGICLSRLAL